MRFSKLVNILLIVSIISQLVLSFETEKSKKNSDISEIHGPLNSTEYIKIYETLNQFKTYLESNKNEDKFLAVKPGNHTDSIICKGCLWIFNNIYNLMIKNYGRIGLFEFLEFICKYFLGMTSEACNGYMTKYGPVIVESVLDHYFTGEYICTLTHMCKYKHFVELEADDYAKDLLADKPTNFQKLEVDENATTLKVLHVTDIHTDLQYAEGSLGECQDPFCCRNSDGKVTPVDPQKRAGKWGYVGKCDLPLRTLLNFVDTVVDQVKPDFIIWTGDNPSHAEWVDDTQQEVFNVTTIFTNLLNEKFNNSVPVYPSLGNHEKFPADQFYPWDNQQESALLKFFADLWKPWLGEEAYQTFIHYGYYTKKHLDTNLRIVSYNCLYCDALNFYLLKNPTDPNNQVDWLENTLRKAEKDNEVIYLVGHIPAGDTSLLSECAKRFKALTDRFSHIIRGQFAGHTHFDEVKIIHEYFNPEKVSGIVYIAPSLTTSSYLNPSFRVFEIDSNTKIVKDYLQYRLNMTLANSNPDENPKWDVSYRASEFFNVTNLNEVDKINEFVLKIDSDKEIYTKVCKAFYADGPQIQMYYNNPKIPTYLKCRFTKDIFNDFFNCIGRRTWNTEDYSFKITNVVSGKWYKRLPDK